jgi:hypothetical protein
VVVASENENNGYEDYATLVVVGALLVCCRGIRVRKEPGKTVVEAMQGVCTCGFEVVWS